MTVRIARRGDNDGASVEGDRRELVRLRGGEDRIHGRLHVAIHRVLEPDGRRQGGGHLPMERALGCARADCAPGEQLRVILRRHQVEDFRRRRHAHPRAVQ